jgi:uncharacterized membrane protein YbjE (DUF340 family)
MQRLFAIIAFIVTLCVMSSPANAATAFLLNCNMQTSVTGQAIWVGQYSYAGRTFSQAFSFQAGYCPATIEIQ